MAVIELGVAPSGPQGPAGPAGTQDTFLTVVPDAGANVVATVPNESLAITSGDSNVIITGDNTAKSIDLSMATNLVIVGNISCGDGGGSPYAAPGMIVNVDGDESGFISVTTGSQDYVSAAWTNWGGSGVTGSFLGTLTDHPVILYANGTNKLLVSSSVVESTVPVKFPSYNVADVPSAITSGAGATIFVPNEVDGSILAFSDGFNWRRCTDRQIISA